MAEEFGKKIEQFGHDIWKKTTDAVGTIGKNAEVSNKSRELKAVYAELGMRFCEKHPSQAEEEFAELTGQAKTLEAEIAELEAQILEQRGTKKCVSCGEEIPLQAAFCSACGAAQPKPEPKAESESTVEGEVVDEWVCPVCGVKNSSARETCVACGAKRP